MKRFLLSVALLLACSGVALAQESEFSGGGGGGITAAPGSGTAGRVPQFASTTSLEDSKMTTSGTNKGTWTLYDDTASTGKSALVIRNGPGQAYLDPLLSFKNNAGADVATFKHDTINGGVVLSIMDIRDTAAATFVLGANNPIGLGLGPTVQVRWGSSAPYTGFDIGLVRGGAAGILTVTDGSTGQGGVGLSDAATNTVTDALILRHATSGTAAASFGTGLLFQGEDAGENMQDMASIDASYTDATNGSEDTRLDFSVYQAGAEVPAVFLTPNTLSGGNTLHLEAPSGHMYFAVGGADRWLISNSIVGALVPLANNTYDFGYSGGQIKDAYIASSIQGSNSVTLTAATDDPFVEIAVPVGGTVGGYVEYTIVADDATDYQARSGILPFTVVNKGGTESATIGTPGAATEVFAESAGASTLTNTFTTDNATGSNNVRIRANAVSSLAETTLAIKCRVVITSGTATLTFNP